ncbi:signal transduction histidine kinase [Archangium gephyra]|uniref:histidine kinase n=1 Tax=Archangium gephyra TaxID=48 RepID=A0AAC8TCC9_9BACT|nr:response regulator [Archangium gephyra]AKI99265.1 Chemotaxis protein methyltransferase CheR [Archangium gephyra]REG31170.1 signal transduction histidine kinase [Archangium gephyra]
MAELTFSATILNVNDDNATRYLTTRTLRLAGYRVLEAANGEEALRLAAQERPDVVVLDVKLPDISGYDVCQRLRSQPHTASIAVMHTSATFVTPDKKVRGLEGGADAYLTEPFEGEELIATVRSLLRMRRAEQDLRRRAEHLTEADRRKDLFLAMLAHELRNPLAAITTAAGILERRAPADPKDARMVSIIQRQTNHLARLVDDLLDVSRLTRGKVELRQARVDLRGVLEQVLTVFRPQAEGRQLKLESSLPAVPMWMEADSTRLVQVFTNLLDNALKYTDAGGTLTVTAERLLSEDGSASARVRVKDTGIGIRPEILPSVFELFSQADESLERTRGGLGIGLTLVHNLVEMHGGRVEAHSDGPGRGSEFVVWLPLQPQAVDAEQEVVLPELVKRRRHILLVEDNTDARQALQDLLETWGHRVEVAADGLRGLELAVQRTPEVALVDIGLPGLDGYRMAEELRAKIGRGIRLVALTGYGGTDDHTRAREAGFDLHLVKPVKPDDLSRLLSEL